MIAQTLEATKLAICDSIHDQLLLKAPEDRAVMGELIIETILDSEPELPVLPLCMQLIAKRTLDEVMKSDVSHEHNRTSLYRLLGIETAASIIEESSPIAGKADTAPASRDDALFPAA